MGARPLGYGVTWERPRERTWSYTPWSLRSALMNLTSLVDLPAERSPVAGKVLRRLYGADWRVSAANDHLTHASLMTRTRAHRPRANLYVNLDARAIRGTPTFVYRDVDYVVLPWVLDHVPADYVGFFASDGPRDRWSRVLAERYRSMSGMFAMGSWYAACLVESGVPPEAVKIVGAGINVPPGDCAPPLRRSRLLFIGRDFRRKAGDAVVAALRLVRELHDPDATLTVIGPERWPMADAPPRGVRFLGRLELSAIATQFMSHDLFVMPSHFEAFGISFLEALAYKVPCVGRDAWEMPQLLQHGRLGRCVASADPEEIANQVISCLRDDDLYGRVAREAAEIRQTWSWARVAERILETIDRDWVGR